MEIAGEIKRYVDMLYWLFSTGAQAYAGIAAFVAVAVFFSLERFAKIREDLLDKTEKPWGEFARFFQNKRERYPLLCKTFDYFPETDEDLVETFLDKFPKNLRWCLVSLHPKEAKQLCVRCYNLRRALLWHKDLKKVSLRSFIFYMATVLVSLILIVSVERLAFFIQKHVAVIAFALFLHSILFTVSLVFVFWALKGRKDWIKSDLKEHRELFSDTVCVMESGQNRKTL